MIPQSDLDNRFTYHPPVGDQIASYEYIRRAALKLAIDLNERVPDSREKALALTHLEDAVMWANAGIARNSGKAARDAQ